MSASVVAAWFARVCSEGPVSADVEELLMVHLMTTQSDTNRINTSER